jgi:hypothetical protein
VLCCGAEIIAAWKESVRQAFIGGARLIGRELWNSGAELDAAQQALKSQVCVCMFMIIVYTRFK